MPTTARQSRVVRDWTADEDAELARLAGAGEPRRAIARRLARSTRSVNNRLCRLRARGCAAAGPPARDRHGWAWGDIAPGVRACESDDVWYFQTPGGRALGTWSRHTGRAWTVGTGFLPCVRIMDAVARMRCEARRLAAQPKGWD